MVKIRQAQPKERSTLAAGGEGATADVEENVVQELISQVHMTLTERPIRMFRSRVFFFFNEGFSFRWHIELGQFKHVVSENTLMFAPMFLDEEIPEELCRFDELKAFFFERVVGDRSCARALHSAAQGRDKLNRSRGAQPRAQGHGGGNMLHSVPSKKHSNHRKE